MKLEIDLKKFKKYIIKNYGKKCGDWSWGCSVCFSWELYEKLSSWLSWDDLLDKEDIDKKNIRKHRNE